MANYILKNDNPILRCSNWAMEVFYERLNTIVHDSGINDETLNDFLEHLNQEIYGHGTIYIEITNYFDDYDSKKLPLKLFYELVDKTIEKIKSEINLMIPMSIY